ncbi:hypothetical protein [Gracilibacillus phocaeensis]|uniref:hypothetical protein n=1 Tax=Gracilibacillus phocaeensis TaxID=2042304 RepID=UPI00102F50CC|nr:hypothetical protein [Gracilibacillus phocaeensis]
MMEKMEKLPEEEKEVVMQLPNSYFERGKEEGIEKGRKEIAAELLAKGMSTRQVVEITKLTEEDVKKLADK